MTDRKLTSPFSFLCWKEDEDCLMASTLDNPRYISLLSVDGISGDDIVQHARDTKSSWEDDVASQFPLYVAAIAKERNISCFSDTGFATVEFADAQTLEVDEQRLIATEEAYEKAVETELLRAQYKSNYTNKKEEKAHHGRGGKHSKDCDPKSSDNQEETDDDDDFETVSSGEENENHDHSISSHETNRKNGITSGILNQLQIAVDLAGFLGLTDDEIDSAFSECVGCKIPSTSQECVQIATNPVVLKFIV